MKTTEYTEVIDGITYTLAIEPDFLPLWGNVSATGDDAVDRAAENEVAAELARGNQWAWCQVIVTASKEHDGYRFDGSDHLGCCSYSGASEFMAEGGYYPDMCTEARKQLSLTLQDAIDRGLSALTLLGYEDEE